MSSRRSLVRTARLWDSVSGEPLGEPMTHNGEVIYAEFSPDGESIITASSDKTVRIWDADTIQPKCEPTNK